MGKTGVDPEKNPLAFLDRLLVEERDTNLHFGDVRFWRHLEYMDTLQIYRTKSVEYRTMKLMFCEAIFYLVFLGVLTSLIIEIRSRDVFDMQRQQFEYWAGCDNRPDPTETVYVTKGCNFFDVKDVGDISPWIRDTFIPKAFTERDLYPAIVESPSIFRLHEGTTAWQPRYIGDAHTTVLVGQIRLRQLRTQRIKAEDCPFIEELQPEQDSCFPGFTEGMQSKLRWAPTWTPEHLLHHYKWYMANFTMQTTMKGLHGTYPGDGFFFDIPQNISGAQTRLKELEAWTWIDHRTRAVILEYTTLNINVNVMVHNRLLFEIPPTGGVSTKYEVFGFRVLQISLSLLASDNLSLFRLIILSSALHFLLFAYTCWLIKQNGKRFFTYFWALCDMMILGIFITLSFIYMNIFSKAAYEPYLAPDTIGDPEMFFPIGHLVPDLELSTEILAVHGLVAWFKVLKYFTLISTFHPFVRIVENTIRQLLLFAGLLFIVLFGFAVAFHAGFGGETDIFSTLRGSFVACIVAPAGGINFDPILKDGTVLGALLVFMYVIIIVFLLVTTFMAIVVDTYSVTTFQIREVMKLDKNTPSGVFWWTYFNALKNVKLVGKETEEDKGKPNEQDILISSLPEAISSRYIETKRRMEMLKFNSEEEIENNRLEKLRKEGKLDDDVFPTETMPMPRGQTGQLALQDQSGPRMLALDDEMPPPPPGVPPSDSIPPEYQDDETGHPAKVSRVQLQRMMDEDPILREICDTEKAIDIMRRFQVDTADIDPYEAVANLQHRVAQMIAELEGQPGHNLTFDELETLKTVSSELHSALTESQREWRTELLSVMQMASLLSKALVDLTRKMEQVQLNHNQLTSMIQPR